jgi:hypothetical protein
VVTTCDECTPPGSARDGWISGRLQDHFGLFKRTQMPKVPQELKEPQIPRQVALTETTKHPQVRLEYGEQALRPVLMHVTTRIFLLRMIHKRMCVSRLNA